MARKRGSYSAEHRAAISHGMREHHVTDETREKIADTMRGRSKSAEHRAKIAEGVRRAHRERAALEREALRGKRRLES
jgi:hypothetical protein